MPLDAPRAIESKVIAQSQDVEHQSGGEMVINTNLDAYFHNNNDLVEYTSPNNHSPGSEAGHRITDAKSN